MASFMPDAGAETPPVLPPKPGSHDASRIGTPAAASPTASASTSASASTAAPPPGYAHNYDRTAANAAATGPYHAQPTQYAGPGSSHASQHAQPQQAAQDPGDNWLPQLLQDKSKQDVAELLASPSLLSALTHSPATTHPSLQASYHGLAAALADNVDLASQLVELEGRLAHQRSATQAQLLSTHTLERQWRQKQSAMDDALAPFSPASLYQRLGQGVQEQALVCRAMEESFLDGDGDDQPVSEREAAEWVRRYRDAKVQYYLRQERKERWDEGRVGGWR